MLLVNRGTPSTGIPLVDSLLEQAGAETPDQGEIRRHLDACQAFFTHLREQYLLQRQERWRTSWFRQWDPKLQQSLSALVKADTAAEIEHLSRQFTEAHQRLNEELESLPQWSESPYLNRLAYLGHGWLDDKLDKKAVEPYILWFRQHLLSANENLKEWLRLPPENPGIGELNTTLGDEMLRLGRRVAGLRDSLRTGDRQKFRALLGDAIEVSARIQSAHQQLEEALRPRTDCPFCGQAVSDGRCGGCGRRLPVNPMGTSSLEVSEQVQSPGSGRPANLVRLEEALTARRTGEASQDEFERTLDWFAGNVQRGLKQLESLSPPQDFPSEEDKARAEQAYQLLRRGGQNMLEGIELLRRGTLDQGWTLVEQGSEMVGQGQGLIAPPE